MTRSVSSLNGIAGAMFKLIPTVRGGAVNSPIVFDRYDTVEAAREAGRDEARSGGEGRAGTTKVAGYGRV